ncbi:hypothetical protein J7L36_00560 [bacterium]|nr:hypothetical protein [bacterium]
MTFSSLELTKSSQIDFFKDRALFRFFEILPGFLSWSTLLGAFFLSYYAPFFVAIFIICFDLFWLIRIIYLSFHQLSSFRQLKKNLKTDWREKLEKEYPERWREIYHLIVLPAFKEGFEIIDSSLEALLNCDYPKEKMIVLLALEERAGKKAKKVAKMAKEKYKAKFFKFLVTFHPKNLPGELPGKGSNVAFAINKTKKEIIRALSLSPENIIISNFDIDTRPYPQYFLCLTYNFLKVKNPFRSSFQPIPLYNNNIWEAPAFSRVISTSGTFWQMMQQERPEQLVTYSSHSFPYKVFQDIGYPSNIVSDDSRVFWKAYLYYNGDYKTVPLNYPVSMDAVMAKTLPRTIVNQYKQQRRWAWGVENIPFLLYHFVKNKKIPLSEKIRHTLIILEGFWSWATTALLIFFLGWLPIFLGGEKFNVTLLSYNLPRLTSNIMTVAMIGMLIGGVISFSLLPPRPQKYSRLKTLSMALQWLLLPLTLIFFGSFPALDAQTRLMLGKELGFWPTEKTRKIPIPKSK